MSEDIRVTSHDIDDDDLPITIEVDGEGGDLLEITIVEGRIYFDRFGGIKENDRQTMYYTFNDLLKKLKRKHG